MQNNVYTVYIIKEIVQKIQNGIGILEGQAVFKLWIKTAKILF